MRYLGIDFGERRIGLAVSDGAGRVAVPLATVERSDDASAVREIVEIARREQVTGLVIGEPLGLDGRRGDAAERVARFARRLEAASGLVCERVAETLTSREAEARLREAGFDPRRNRARVDAVAAQIVLQEALDRRRTGSGG